MPKDYSVQIQTGVAKLNEHFDGTDWVDAIDLERLNTESLGDCVFGQLFPTYDSRPDGWTFELEYGFDIQRGLNGPAYFAEHAALTRQWKAYLQSLGAK